MTRLSIIVAAGFDQVINSETLTGYRNGLLRAARTPVAAIRGIMLPLSRIESQPASTSRRDETLPDVSLPTIIDQWPQTASDRPRAPQLLILPHLGCRASWCWWCEQPQQKHYCKCQRFDCWSMRKLHNNHKRKNHSFEKNIIFYPVWGSQVNGYHS